MVDNGCNHKQAAIVKCGISNLLVFLSLPRDVKDYFNKIKVFVLFIVF